MNKRIPFNIPLVLGNEIDLVKDAIHMRSFSGPAKYSILCEDLLKDITKAKCVLLTSSCTHALEMTALLLDIVPGDEVIMASFNFVSAANPFVLRGAKIVFVDIDPYTLNIDASKISGAITKKTKAILVTHYGGVPCNMDQIEKVGNAYNIPIVEDAAHCIGSKYRKQHLGIIGEFGAISFHSTKNIHCGEGGALLINNEKWIDRANKIRDKGTNRVEFLEGKKDKYTWVDIGSSYSINELSSAFLYAQLKHLDTVTQKRISLVNMYIEEFGKLDLNYAPTSIKNGNGHIFYCILPEHVDRSSIVKQLKNKGISAYFHYIPLHSSPAGNLYSSFHGEDQFTSNLAGRVLRLPVYYEMTNNDIKRIVKELDSVLTASPSSS